MSIMRPGEFRITDRGIELTRLGKGSCVLDIGCGEGDTLARLVEKYGMKGEGIDRSLPRIRKAKEKHPGLDVKFGDGEFLDEYSSYTFDGVFMECVLSLINIPDESLHEVYCVLRKGGSLVMSDLYERDPDPDKLKAVRIEAERQSRLPHEERETTEHSPDNDPAHDVSPERFVDFRLNGAFFKEPLIEQLEEIGFEVKAFEDFTPDLKDYAAQVLMDEGSLDSLSTSLDEDGKNGKRDIGYFLLVAEKPLK